MDADKSLDNKNTNNLDLNPIDTPNVRRVKQTLERAGLNDTKIVCFEDSARTAELAAQAIGCHVGQIVKSLVFKAANRDQLVLALVSGKNRLNEKRARDLLGFKLEKADAAFVRATTGFAIGGVAPIGHLTQENDGAELVDPVDRIILVDQDLLQYDQIWAAAGHPNTVFAIQPADLLKLIGTHQILDCRPH